MKYICIVFSLLLLSCLEPSNYKKEKPKKYHKSTYIQSLLDSASVEGAIVLYDLQKKQYYSNDFNWARKGQLPASTFKIPNSLIALETSVIQDENTIVPWNGASHYLALWEQDLTFAQAFHYSCVPCYQSIARQVGLPRMQDYLQQLSFGSMQVDSTNVDRFWLQGDSRISPLQQIDFLQRLYRSELPISKRTDSIFKKMAIVSTYNNGLLRAKTGLSNVQGNYNGWYVGYLEKGREVFFFALNIQPSPSLLLEGLQRARKTIVYEMFAHQEKWQE